MRRDERQQTKECLRLAAIPETKAKIAKAPRYRHKRRFWNAIVCDGRKNAIRPKPTAIRVVQRELSKRGELIVMRGKSDTERMRGIMVLMAAFPRWNIDGRKRANRSDKVVYVIKQDV